MRVEVEVNGRKITAVSVDERGKVPPPEVEIDCRKGIEIPASETPPPEGGPKRVRLPFTAKTLSEQDMDQARREFSRAQGPFTVLSETGNRAAAVVLAHAGRVHGWSVDEVMKRCPGLAGQADLALFVREYLERHANRSERKEGIEV